MVKALSLHGNDALHFTELAHALKGSAAYLGLLELAEQANVANNLLASELASQGGDCLRHLESAFERAKSALETELQYDKPAALH